MVYYEKKLRQHDRSDQEAQKRTRDAVVDLHELLFLGLPHTGNALLSFANDVLDLRAAQVRGLPQIAAPELQRMICNEYFAQCTPNLRRSVSSESGTIERRSAHFAAFFVEKIFPNIKKFQRRNYAHPECDKLKKITIRNVAKY